MIYVAVEPPHHPLMEKLQEVHGEFGFKVNLDFLLKWGIKSGIKYVKSFGKPVFADVKMFNGRRTMEQIAIELIESGVDIFNAHIISDTQIDGVIARAQDSKVEVYGVTIMTHYDHHYCYQYFSKSLVKTVRMLTRQALSLGFNGVIVPGTVLQDIQNIPIDKMCPGIRSTPDERHAQVTDNPVGAKHVVIGRPITEASDPQRALEEALDKYVN